MATTKTLRYVFSWHTSLFIELDQKLKKWKTRATKQNGPGMPQYLRGSGGHLKAIRCNRPPCNLQGKAQKHEKNLLLTQSILVTLLITGTHSMDWNIHKHWLMDGHYQMNLSPYVKIIFHGRFHNKSRLGGADASHASAQPRSRYLLASHRRWKILVLQTQLWWYFLNAFSAEPVLRNSLAGKGLTRFFLCNLCQLDREYQGFYF